MVGVPVEGDRPAGPVRPLIAVTLLGYNEDVEMDEIQTMWANVVNGATQLSDTRFTDAKRWPDAADRFQAMLDLKAEMDAGTIAPGYTPINELSDLTPEQIAALQVQSR